MVEEPSVEAPQPGAAGVDSSAATSAVEGAGLLQPMVEVSALLAEEGASGVASVPKGDPSSHSGPFLTLVLLLSSWLNLFLSLCTFVEDAGGDADLAGAPEYFVKLPNSDDDEGCQPCTQGYEFGFNHRDDNNFEHCMESDLTYMVSLVRNPERAQYGSMSLIKGTAKSRMEMLNAIERLPWARWHRLIRFLYLFLMRQSTQL